MATPVFGTIMLKTRIALRDDKVMGTGVEFDTSNLNEDGALTSEQIQLVCNDSIKDFINQTVNVHITKHGKDWGDTFAEMYPELIDQNAQPLITLDPNTARTDNLPSNFGWWITGKIDGAGNIYNADVVFGTARQFYFARTKGNTEMNRYRAAFIENQIHVYRRESFTGTIAGLAVTYLYVPIETDIVYGGATDTIIPKKAIPGVVALAVLKATNFKKLNQ